MKHLHTLVRWWSAVNVTALGIGRTVGWALLMVMVAVILAQVWWRYVLNSPLSWPEEAARAAMIWMMALVAPTAYRRAGFVAIDLVPDMLPRRMRGVLDLFILALSLAALVVMASHAWTHFSSPILFNSSGLNRLVQDSGINALLGTAIEFRESYIYLAMSVCLWLLISVNLELILRAIGRTFGVDENAREWFAIADGTPVTAE